MPDTSCTVERAQCAKCPWCCHGGCEADAEFEIHEERGDISHHDNYTQACALHVGALLGSTAEDHPTDHWIVSAIAVDARLAKEGEQAK